MEKDQFITRVRLPRRQGKSIRATAAEPGVDTSRIQRALRPGASVPHATGKGTGPFVGRQAELDTLTDALSEALAGVTRTVLLAGEPGIGKTRTLQEIASTAKSRGALALWGRCYEGEGAPPFWPWAQTVRAFVQERGTGPLLSISGPAVDIAEIVPELGGLPPERATRPAMESPEQARFRLFTSVTEFFKAMARAQPLALVLDDLQWADRPSLAVLEFLAREVTSSPLLVLGAYRDSDVSPRHPLSRILGSLSREPHFQRLTMRGLSEAEVSEFIRRAAMGSHPPEVARAIHQRTRGNPLFVTQVVQLLERQGVEGTPDWQRHIPSGVKVVIGSRIARLPDLCRQVLTTASVVGTEFHIRVLSALHRDIPDDNLLEALDAALEANIIEEVTEQPGRFRFSHVLVQQTLTDAMSSVRRARLHARIAAALEELAGDDLAQQVAQLAFHYSEAQALVGSEKFVRYAIAAGEQALASHAYEEARGYFQRALDAMGTRPVDSLTADALFGLGRAQAALLYMQPADEAVTTLTRAFNYYWDAGEAAKALAVAEYPVVNWPGGLTMSDVITRALSLAPRGSVRAGHLHARHGFDLGLVEGDYAGADRAFQEALSIAERNDDPVLKIRTLASAARVDGLHARWQGSLDRGLAVIELARKVQEPQAEAIGHFWAALSLLTTGTDTDRTRFHVQAAASLARERLRDRYSLTSSLLLGTGLAMYAGQWEQARDWSNQALALAPQDVRHLILRTVLEYDTGDVQQCEQYLALLVEALRQAVPGPTIECGHGALGIAWAERMLGTFNHLDLARSLAQSCLSSPRAIPVVKLWANACLALIALHQGDAELAERQYQLLQPHQDTLVHQSVDSVDRILGLLAAAIGRPGDAASHMENALGLCRRARNQREYAWTCHDYAMALLETDHHKSSTLIGEGLMEARQLGMRPLISRLEGLQNRLASRGRDQPQYPAGLSQREVEVLRLIASGKSNAEIARELFISPNTVAHHITNILNKTGAANRTEAAAFAAWHGLISRQPS